MYITWIVTLSVPFIRILHDFVFISFAFIRLRLSYHVLISSCAYMYPPPFFPLSLPPSLLHSLPLHVYSRWMKYVSKHLHPLPLLASWYISNLIRPNLSLVLIFTYLYSQVDEVCFEAFDMLMTLRRAMDLQSTKDLRMYPTAESLNTLELLYGEAVSRADLDGLAGEWSTFRVCSSPLCPPFLSPPSFCVRY